MNEIDTLLKESGFKDDFVRTIIDNYVWWQPPQLFFNNLNNAIKDHYAKLELDSPECFTFPHLLSLMKHGVCKNSFIVKVNIYAYNSIFTTITNFFLNNADNYSHYSLLRWYVSLVCVLEEFDFSRCVNYKTWEDLKTSVYGPLFALSRCSLLDVNFPDWPEMRCRMVADVFGGVCLANTSARTRKRKRGYLSIDDWLDIIKSGKR